MEISQMRFFLEVAKNEHITKSAENLHIAQPSLTQSIHKLEDEIGVPLFEKKGRNIVLTEYGKCLRDKLTPVIGEIDRLPYELRNMAKLNNKTINLNVLAVSMLVTDAVIEYRQKRDDVSFKLLQNYDSESYDISVTTGEYSRSDDSAGKKSFTKTEKIYLAVPNNDKYRNKTSIKLSEVIDEGFICLYGSRQFRLICDKICREIGFRPNIIFESDNPASVVNMIATNMGVGFFPGFSWGHIEEKHIRLLEIEDAIFKRDIIVSVNLNKTDNGVLLDFYGFLEKYISEKCR